MIRGDVVIAALAGDYGKPRPCLIVQSDRLAKLDSVLVCPFTTDLGTAGPTRMVVPASPGNGLTVTSLLMVDKVTAISRSRCRTIVGAMDRATTERVGGLLLLVLGLLD